MARKPGQHLSAPEREKRRAEVEAMMALGVANSEIRQKISEKHDVSIRMVSSDIHTIYKRWEEEGERQRPMRRNQMREMLRRIIRSALSEKQHSAAVAAAARLMELDGLRSLKVEHSGMVETRMRDMTSDEKRQRLSELINEAQRLSGTNGANGSNRANGGANGANGSNGHGGNGATAVN